MKMNAFTLEPVRGSAGRASPPWRRVLAVWLAATALVLGLPAHAVAPASLAPDFTLRSLDGPNVRLREQRGRVVMINFWASWCGPCRQEMPHLNRLHDKYRAAGLVLLGVNIDEDPRTARELAARLGIRFPVLLDSDKAVSRRYELATMPSTVILDRDGQVRFLHRGYQAGLETTYDRQVLELLK